MGPNDVDIVRVFTRAQNGTTAEEALPYNAPFEVVVEAEAGLAAFQQGGQFAIGVVVRDLSKGNFLTATPNPPPPPATPPQAVTPGLFASANLNSTNWPTQTVKFVYTVAAPGGNRENDIGDVLATLRFGVQSPDVSSTQSSIFIITRP